MVTSFKFDEFKTIHSRVTPSFFYLFGYFGGMISLILALGSAFVNSVPEYLFKVNIIQSLFRFKSDEDLD